MTLFYTSTFVLSTLMCVIYFCMNRKRNVWLQLLFQFVMICNAGYLMLSLSKTLTMALTSNAVAYLGNVFLPFFVLMMVMRISCLQYPKWLPNVLVLLNCAMFLIATSGGYSSVYYKEVSLEIVDNTAYLVKVYGPLHGLYKVYLFAYFFGAVAIVCYTAIRKTAVSTKHSAFLALVLLGNIALWLVENLIGTQYEFLSISYIMTEGLILLLYSILQEYEMAAPAVAPTELAYTDADSETVEEIALSQAFSEQQIRRIFAGWTQTKTLTQRECEVLRFILEKRKRKDIAQVLFVTESTVKKHTSNVYRKLDVANRTQLFEKAMQFITT